MELPVYRAALLQAAVGRVFLTDCTDEHRIFNFIHMVIDSWHSAVVLG
jgi:hypothetical protein